MKNSKIKQIIAVGLIVSLCIPMSVWGSAAETVQQQEEPTVQEEPKVQEVEKEPKVIETNQWKFEEGRWRYQHADGSYATDVWEYIGEMWYHFDGAGWMQTSWIELGSTWYYLYENGAMAVSEWIGNYYVKANGAMAVNEQVGDVYVDGNGLKVQVGWILQGGRWWYREADGTYPASEWRLLGDEWYHFDSAGWMQTSWIELGSTWYYLRENGVMAVSEWIGNYYVKANGAMAVNEQVGDVYVNGNGLKMQVGWILQGDRWWYREADGTYPASEWRLLGNKWYHFDSSGWMQTSWIQLGSTWYYLRENGVMEADKWIGNYYVNANGAMEENTWVGDYYVNENGTYDARYNVTSDTQQLVYVQASGTNAEICMLTRNQDGTNRWSKQIDTAGYIGSNGLGKEKEGDHKTPVGVYKLGIGFGIESNPGTSLSYTQVDDSYYWVDDSNSRYYNQFVTTNQVTKDWNSAEHLIDYTRAYKYAIEIEYNKEAKKGAGAAIFLHCSTNGPTAGCVSVPESQMIAILNSVTSSAKIVIK